MANYYLDEDGKLITDPKKKKGKHYIMQSDGTIILEQEEEIAPVKADEGKLDFFQKGAFEDGYQFGDVTKSILGTAGDAGVGVVKGAAGMVEGISDLGLYAGAGIADLFGADEEAEKKRKQAQKNSVQDAFKGVDDYLDQYSLLGRTSDAAMQGLGQVGTLILTGGLGSAAGLGTAGVTALTTGTMGVSSMGSGMSEAYNDGATDGEAFAYGLSKGAIDAGTELIFGGLGKSLNAIGLSKGISSLDDTFAKALSSKISNQVAKNLVEFGVKASGEGFEELLAGYGTAVAKHFTYMDEEEIKDIIADENLLEQFVVGMATSGMIQSGYIPGTANGSLKDANAKGTDFITGYTQNEQAVIDKLVEQETDGKKLTKKEIGEIEKQVKNSLERGEIDIDTIESVLGGETYTAYDTLLKESQEYEELYKTKRIDMSQEQADRLAELTEKNEKTPYKTELSSLKEKLSQEVRTTTQNDTFLLESYNEKGRKSKTFEADLTKYDEKQQETVKKAMDSGILNDTRKTHDFVDMLAKLSAEKGVSFDFTNNKALKESGFALEGKTVNGYKQGNNIALNIESAKALNTVVGHEVTHVLEGTKLYNELQTAIFEYAKSKGDFDARSESIKNLYDGRFKGTSEEIQAKLNKEITADLVGDYLFTDSDFINNLSATKPNVFKKIYNEIKYLLKLATAGSKEARQLEKVKKTFDKAFKESDSNRTDNNVTYSLNNILDSKVADRLNPSEWNQLKTIVAEHEKLNYSYQNSADGDIIVPIGNKLVYTDANFDSPGISRVIEFESDYENDIDYAREELYAVEKGESTIEEAYEVIRLFTGIENINEYKTENRANAGKYDRRTSRGKSQSDSYHNNFLQERIRSANEIIHAVNSENAKTSSKDDVFSNVQNTDIQYSLSEDSGTLTKGQKALIEKTNNMSVMKNYGKDTYSIIATNEFGFDTYRNYNATIEEITEKYGSEIAERIAKHKKDGKGFALEKEFLILPPETDTEGRKLTVEQGKYFKNVAPELKDDNGNLKVLYHGTPNEFTQFNYDFIGSNGTALGKGFYLTDSKDIASGYTGENGKVMELYANIEKPLSLTEKTITKAQYKKFVKAVDTATNGDYLTNYGEVDYDGYDKVLNSALEDYQYDDNDVDLIHSVFNAGGLEWEDGFRLLKKTLGYDGVVQQDFNGTGSTVFVPTLPEQIKSVDNAIPTDNPDINLSLSGKNDIAPVGKYNVYGKDIALETVSEMENVVPLAQEKTDLVQDVVQDVDEYAPMTEEQANERDAMQDGLYSLNESDMPEDIAPYYDEELGDVEAVSPFDDKDIQEVGDRKQKAYMYENPEVKPYFQEEAQIMLGELKNSVKGERVVNADLVYESGGEFGVWGTKRETSEQIAYMLDRFKYSYADIEKGLNAIIEDHGAENNAISKRLEFMIDERLREGYTDFLSGMEIPSNQDYINLLRDKQINSYTDEAYAQYLESLADHFRDTTKMMDDIAPTYEAIEPRPQTTSEKEAEWANNKMKKATTPLDGPKERRFIASAIESEVVDGKVQREDLDQRLTIYNPISNKKTLGNANAMLDNFGYEKSVNYFESKLMDKKVSLDDIALGERLIQEAIKSGDYKTAGELIQDVAILGTELGQKVQALSIIQRLTPEGQLKMLQKTVNRGKAKGDKAFEGVEITQEMIDHILSVYGKDGKFDQKKLDKAVEDTKQKIADQMKVTKMDKVNAWRYLAMLGNPKTHIRNLVSNVAMRGTLKVKNALARTIEDIAPIKDKTKTWRKATDEVKAFVDETAIEMKDVISDDSKYSEEASIKAKRDIFKNKILQSVYEFNSDLLSKEDWWFSKPAFKDALGEFLTANGIRTKEDIANNKELVEKAKQYAVEQSQIATFRQYSWLANKIKEIENKNTATDITVGSILPFKKTPINIAKAGLSYSPLGFAKTLTYDMAKVKKGEMNASEAVDHLAQNVTGTALTLIGYMLASAGFLNGGGDDDKEGKYDYQLGKQAYSLSFGGATYSLSWLSPVAMPLFVGANAYEQLVEGKEWNADVVMETLAQTLDPLSEMSFLSSLDSVLSSYDSGMQKFAGIGETMLQSYATQFIPTLSSQIATVMDDKKRSTKVAGDSGNKIIEGTINKLIYKIPGLRETLEPSTDIWGNDIMQTENIVERAFETFIAPYAKKSDISTEVDSELKSLYAETGDNGLLPNVPYNYVNYQNEKYKMSAEEYTDFKKTYGQNAYDLLEELFATTTYQSATTEDRTKMVNEVYDYARDEAKKEYLAKEGVEYTNSTSDGIPIYKENHIKGAVDNDMSLEEFDAFVKSPEKYSISSVFGGYDRYASLTNELKGIEGEKDEDGNTINGSKKENTINYIDGLDLEYGEKIILFKSQYPKDDTYNMDIVEYLNSRNDITFEEEMEILKGLGFTVESDGTVSW